MARWILYCLWLTQPTPTSSQSTAPVAESGDTSIHLLVEALGNPDFAERQTALDSLKNQSKSVLPELKKIYRAQTELDIRLQIREVAEAIIYREHAVHLGGFLGIGQRPLNHMDDSRIPTGQTAVEIIRVLPETSAAKADLRVGDVMTALNGRPFEFDPADQSGFVRLVTTQAPGSPLRLSVLRGEEVLEKQIVLAVRPAQYINLSEPRHVAVLQAAGKEFAQWCAELEETADSKRAP